MKDEIKIGDEYWTWIVTKTPSHDTPFVRKIKVKEVFAVMVVADIIDSIGQIEIPKTDLYSTQDEALDELHKIMDEAKK